MSKLVIVFALICSVFGAEIGSAPKHAEPEVKAPIAAAPVPTPYAAYNPYAVQGFPGHYPYHHGYSGFPYTHGAYNAHYDKSVYPYGAHYDKSVYPYGAYQHPYHYSGYPYPTGAPLQKSAALATPYSHFGAHPFGAPSPFGYPGYGDFSRPAHFGRSVAPKA
ncbi:uncharacterized protein LOC116174109 [Photinus pyralis]|uniref:uncharacterized protein LOC116174109 n=1 Tax=Photinus pyralis TaxID=7054 RepID=UPI001266F641|nr:uncharacterized protein LOC116174109 [Photinus pyralis]